MSDFLVNLNPTARSVVKTLGLPVPLPQRSEARLAGFCNNAQRTSVGRVRSEAEVQWQKQS